MINPRAALIIIMAAVTLPACGKGGDCADVAGTWNATEVADASACGSGTSTEQRSYTITQDGCNLTVTTGGMSGSGIVSGTHLGWSGTLPSTSGTTTITGMDVSLSGDGKSASGVASWTWSGSGKSCTGTTQITATRVGGSSSGAPAGVAAFCDKAVQCQVADQKTCEALATFALQGMVPDLPRFESCVQGLQCSRLMEQTAVQGCLDIDNAATRCSGQSLHLCARTGSCVDVSCATACGYLALTFDHCGFDASKQRDACYCR